jgi:hypothetical protein
MVMGHGTANTSNPLIAGIIKRIVRNAPGPYEFPDIVLGPINDRV